MNVIGYFLVALSLYILYESYIVFGIVLFIIGGVFAGKISFSFRSIGVVTLLTSLAWWWNYGFSLLVLLFCLIGFFMANAPNNPRIRGRRGDDWGFNFDLADLFSGGSDSGDCGD